MAGMLVRDAPHLDGSEDIGVWFDAAWAAYAGLGLQLDRDRLDHIEELWDGLRSVSDDGVPAPEEWGTSERAQQSQAALMAMFGGSPDMGAAPSLGDEG